MRPPSAISKFAMQNKASNFSDVQSTTTATNKVSRGLGYDKYEYTEKSPRLPGIKSLSNRIGFDSQSGSSVKKIEEHDHNLHIQRTNISRSKKPMPTYSEQQESLKKYDQHYNKQLQKQNEKIRKTSMDYGIDLDMTDFLKAGSVRFVKEQNKRKMLREKKYASIGGNNDSLSRKL